MSRPLLPSEKHPDYPKWIEWVEEGRHYAKPPPTDTFIAFYQAHPEFENEGEWKTVCPYCGDDADIEPTEMCCGEVHAEWQYFDENGEPADPPRGQNE